MPSQPDGVPAEFGLIARHFRPLAGPGALDLLDDAAVVMPPPGRELVITTDAIVEGVHFLPSDPPFTVAQKLVRVSLSDLAAMGATPWAYLTTVSVPRGTPAAWWEGFAAGLAADQAAFGLILLGGDTTSTPGPISLTATLLGHVAPGQALTRAGARAGDDIWVTGTIGDGALGLRALRGEIADPDGFLTSRYRVPTPRLGAALHGIVRAGMDVSDGLIQDIGHLCRAAGLGAEIDPALIPLSAAARAAGPEWLECCLTGGDDYELVLALDPSHGERLVHACRFDVTRIGRFTAAPGVTVTGQIMTRTGFSHF